MKKYRIAKLNAQELRCLFELLAEVPNENLRFSRFLRIFSPRNLTQKAYESDRAGMNE